MVPAASPQAHPVPEAATKVVLAGTGNDRWAGAVASVGPPLATVRETLRSVPAVAPAGAVATTLRSAVGRMVVVTEAVLSVGVTSVSAAAALAVPTTLTGVAADVDTVTMRMGASMAAPRAPVWVAVYPPG